MVPDTHFLSFQLSNGENEPFGEEAYCIINVAAPVTANDEDGNSSDEEEKKNPHGDGKIKPEGQKPVIKDPKGG